ncbi:MAG: choice-of-anchor I family protein [Thiohalomonadaceae bacterium]
MWYRRQGLISVLAGGVILSLLSGCVDDGVDGLAGQPGQATQVIALNQIGRTVPQGFGVSAAEIVAFDSINQRLFAVNAQSGEVDVFNTASVENMAIDKDISLNMGDMLLAAEVVSDVGEVGAANSIAVRGELAAVAVEANPKTDNGWVVFLNVTDFSFVIAVEVGAQPDMVAFTPDGSKVLSANEGEPNEGYSIDPEGSVSVITVADFSVVHIGFTDFNADAANTRFAELDLNRMVLDGYNASVAQSLEPEYIAFNADGSKAYVAMQENNAIAVLDLSDNSVESIMGLGFKDHSIPGNEMDAGDADGGVRIKSWPVMGIYMPDSITSMTYNGNTYLLTANEGDSREDFLIPIIDQASCESAGYYVHGGECVDEVRVKHLVSRAGLTLGAALIGLDGDDNLGRLKASYHTTRIMNGNDRADGTEKSSPINTVYAYGARSFSIWNMETGEQVFDSGNDFERLTAMRYGAQFNMSNTGNAGDSRSDDKGPEPEAIITGKINGYTYAFIGLERMGGIMVYDVSNPYAPRYVQYVNNRDLSISASAVSADAGDLGPEGLAFVSASDSPNGKPLLMVGNEVSGTVAIYEINVSSLQAE